MRTLTGTLTVSRPAAEDVVSTGSTLTEGVSRGMRILMAVAFAIPILILIGATIALRNIPDVLTRSVLGPSAPEIGNQVPVAP